jgi:hypothetical protein
MAESCKGCYHWRGVKDCEYCHYLLDTGFPRNCPADNCLFYKKEFFKMGKGHKIPEEVRKKVMEFARDGVSPKNIARSLGIGLTSVRRILKSTEQKKSPETVSTPIEPVTEDITDSGNPADTNILADIVENVKQAGTCENNCIPDIVKEVVSHALDNLANEIHILAGRLEELKADRTQLEKWYFENCNEEVKHGTR